MGSILPPEVVGVPMYLIDRNFSTITEEELGEFARNSKRLAQESYTDVVWHHSHVVIDPSGVVHTFCVYSAPDESRIREHGQALARGVPADAHRRHLSRKYR